MDKTLKKQGDKRVRRIRYLEKVKTELIQDFHEHCFTIEVTEAEYEKFESEVTKIDKAIKAVIHQINNIRYLRGKGIDHKRLS